MSDVTTALATISKATQALMKAEKLEDVSTIRSHAKVFQIHAKEFRLGREALLEGARVQLLAELKAGAIAIEQAKEEGFKKMLEDARLTPDQVSKWRREASNIANRFGEDNLYESLTKRVNDYIDSVRKDPNAASLDSLPSFRGFLFFLEGGSSEQHQKEPRTELTKIFCKVYPFEEAEEKVASWLKDKGRSKEDKAMIEEMWAGVKKMGNLFLGQASASEE